MKKLNKIVAVIIALLMIYLSFYNSNYFELLFLLLLIVPFIIKIPPIQSLIYLIMIFLTMCLGFQFTLYQTTTYYDKLVHFLFGIVISIPALWILIKFKKLDSLWFTCIFIFCFGAAIGVLWEVVEYIIDSLVGSDMQRRTTGIQDSMQDIIVCSLGHIVFIMWYIFEVKFNKPIIIDKLIKEME